MWATEKCQEKCWTFFLSQETRRDREGVDWFAQKELIIIVAVPTASSYALQKKSVTIKPNFLFRFHLWFHFFALPILPIGKVQENWIHLFFVKEKRCPMKRHFMPYFRSAYTVCANIILFHLFMLKENAPTTFICTFYLAVYSKHFVISAAAAAVLWRI